MNIITLFFFVVKFVERGRNAEADEHTKLDLDNKSAHVNPSLSGGDVIMCENFSRFKCVLNHALNVSPSLSY